MHGLILHRLALRSGIISNPIFRQGLRARAERYAQNFCAAFGDDAARNTADEDLRQLGARSAFSLSPRPAMWSSSLP
jgi:hypothetical protein